MIQNKPHPDSLAIRNKDEITMQIKEKESELQAVMKKLVALDASEVGGKEFNTLQGKIMDNGCQF